MADCATCPHHSEILSAVKVLETKFEAQKELLNARFLANEHNKMLAKEDMERRLEDMNEFRSQLSTQANTFATRPELKAEAEKLDLKLAPLLRQASMHEGASHWSNHIITVMIAAAVMLFIHFVFKI